MTKRSHIGTGSPIGGATTLATRVEFERERIMSQSRLAAAQERLQEIDTQVRDLCAQGLPQGKARSALRRLCGLRRQARRAYWHAGTILACGRFSPAARAYLASCTCRACGWREWPQPLTPRPLTEQEGLCDRCLQHEDERQRRGALRRWARDLLERARQSVGAVLVLDTETTGLDPEADEVVELALLDGGTGHVLFHTLLCPSVPISPGAEASHGITADLLVTAPRFDAIAPRLTTLLHNKLVVVFNRFHVTLLQATALRYGATLPAHLLEEVQAVVRVAYQLRPASLPNFAAQFGVPATGHRASDHALAAWQVVRNIASEGEEEPPVYLAAQRTYPEFALGTMRFPPEDASGGPGGHIPF